MRSRTETGRKVTELLKNAIVEQGAVLGGGILKVDSFLNHQVDPYLMNQVGLFIADQFSCMRIDKVFTAESSGIAPALAAAMRLEVPMIFARKKKPITMLEAASESAPSHTKGGTVNLYVSTEFLKPYEHVLIVDDFLASGLTIAALGRIIVKSGCELVGIAAVIEKTFEGGRDFLKERFSVPILSVVEIESLDSEGPIFRDCN